jgi:hypothetical protein
MTIGALPPPLPNSSGVPLPDGTQLQEETPPPLDGDVVSLGAPEPGEMSVMSYAPPSGVIMSTQQMALNGWEAMRMAPSAQDQCRIGLSTARSILDYSSNQTEKIVAFTALSAYDRLGSIPSSVNLLYITLQALAVGVSGPIGAVLASVGENALVHADGARDQCQLGTTFATSIKRYSGNETEQALIGTALQAYSSLGSVSSGASLMDHILLSIKPWGYGPIDATVGKAGLECMDAVTNPLDQCRVGTSFTKTVAATTISASEKELAQKALDEYAQQPDTPAGAAVIHTYLNKFAGVTPPDPSPPPPLPPLLKSDKSGTAVVSP